MSKLASPTLPPTYAPKAWTETNVSLEADPTQLLAVATAVKGPLAEVQVQALNDRPQQESFIKFVFRNFYELSKLKFALTTFVVNTLRRRYHNSVLGYAWSLLNPLLTMGVMTLVFSQIFHREPQKFAIYLFSAMLPWSFVTEALVGGSTSLISFEGFLKKIYLPKTFFPLVIVSISACNFTFSLLSLLVLGLFCGVQPSVSLLLIPVATLVLFTFNFGMALLLAVCTLYLRDLTHIVTVLLGTLFYLMPIVYPVEQMPKEYHYLFEWNPFYYFLFMFKTIMYEAKVPTLEQWATPVGISLVTLLIALYVLKLKEKDIMYRL